MIDEGIHSVNVTDVDDGYRRGGDIGGGGEVDGGGGEMDGGGGEMDGGGGEMDGGGGEENIGGVEEEYEIGRAHV